ncbi:MAG: hypothetical protein ACKVPX_16405 [Myxococcaceae bacterium]
MRVWDWLVARMRKLAREHVEVTDDKVVRHLASGRCEVLHWHALRRVEVRTTARGPWGEDFFFILYGENNARCVVPNSQSGRLFDKLQGLPNFDFQTFIRATASSGHARFLCWENKTAAPRAVVL